MDQVLTFIAEAWAIDWVKALVVVALSIVLAKLSDVVLCRILRLAAARTRSDLDDQIIEILHRPIFMSVLLVGLYYAGVVILEVEGPSRFLLVAFLKTLSILIWVVAGFCILRVVLEGVGRAAERVSSRVLRRPIWVTLPRSPESSTIQSPSLYGASATMNSPPKTLARVSLAAKPRAMPAMPAEASHGVTSSCHALSSM